MTEQDRDPGMEGDLPKDDAGKQGGMNQPGQGGGMNQPGQAGTGTMGQPGTTARPESTGSPDADDPGMGREGDDTERRPSG